MPLFDTLAKSLTIRGYILNEVTTDPGRLERGKRIINEGLADGSLKPIIAKHLRWIRLSKRIGTWSRTSKSEKSGGLFEYMSITTKEN